MKNKNGKRKTTLLRASGIRLRHEDDAGGRITRAKAGGFAGGL
jgi:hypothetical protein